jgi:serine protease Do
MRMPSLVRAWIGLVLVGHLVGGGQEASRALGQDEAQELSSRFRKAARRVLPSVVTVRAEPGEKAAIPGALPAGSVPRDPGGSGFVIDARRGLILTNDHVVRGAGRVVVNLHDGRERVVKEVRHDPRSDLALLVIEGNGLTASAWGDSDALDLGDWVLAIGQPFGLAGTLTVGIVSGKGRGIGTGVYEDLIQTDAAINPGNSGGPLINLSGEVIGINTAIKTLGGGYEGVGFAVPSGRARRVASDLATYGHVRRASIGVLVGHLDPAVAERLGPSPAVPIRSIAPLGPAADAGLRVGDLILGVGGKPVRGVGMLQETIEAAPIGQPISVTVAREGRRFDVSVRPAPLNEATVVADIARPAPTAPAPGTEPERPRAADAARSPTRFPELGLRLSEPTEALARHYGYTSPPEGLIVRGVEPGGAADAAGLEIGMAITDVGGHAVKSLAEFRERLASRTEGRDVIIRVLRGSKPEFRVILAETIRDDPARRH